MKPVTQFIVRYRLLILYSVTLLVGIVLGIIIVTRPKPVDESVTRFNDTRSSLMALADDAKTKQSFSKLPEDQRQNFLEQQARLYAIDSQVQPVTPDTLRGACVEKSEENLIDSATRLRAEEGPEKFKNYVTLYTHAKATARANCYMSFDPTGVEDVPAMMAHP